MKAKSKITAEAGSVLYIDHYDGDHLRVWQSVNIRELRVSPLFIWLYDDKGYKAETLVLDPVTKEGREL